MSSFHPTRYAPTERPRTPAYPPALREPPDTRPVTHPCWPGFVELVRGGRLGINRRLADDPEQYALNGALLFAVYVAGREDGE